MNQNKEKSLNSYNSLLKKAFESLEKKNYQKAESLLIEAIQLNIKKYEAYINLSNVYILQSDISSALELLFGYVEKYNFNENISNHLAKICLRYELNNELQNLFALTKLDNREFNIYKKNLFYIQGIFFEKKSNHIKAIQAFKNSIKCDKNFFNPYIPLLNLLESVNDIKNFNLYIQKAKKTFSNIYEVNIINYFNSLLLNRKKQYNKSLNLISELNLVNNLKNSDFFFPKLLDLEVKNYEKLSRFSEAFEKVYLRNEFLKNTKESKNFDKDLIFRTIKQYKKFYTKENIKKISKRLKYNNHENLVFLVGFPRSGTTLLDTILRTHSKINVLEEKPFLLELRHNFFKEKKNNLESLLNISQSEKDEISLNYLKKIDAINIPSTQIIVDKLPLSILELGFIKIIFPQSKIILALRNPCDVIISCFFSAFKINEAMINFLDWDKTIKFYNEVFELFEFYEGQLNLNHHIIKYEDVIYDFKIQITSLLEFLNLDYEPKLEKFHLTAINREKISTPSYTQVINPLYKSSIGRWENYKHIKSPEKNLQKWINKFNY